MTVTQGLHFDQLFHRKYYWLKCHKGQKWLNYHRGHNWQDDQRNLYRLNVIELINWQYSNSWKNDKTDGYDIGD